MGTCNPTTFGSYNSKTAESYQLDAGAVFKNWEFGIDTYETAIKAGKLIGATQGGNSLSVIPTMRQVQADGAKGPWKDGEVIDAWKCTLTANFLEMTKDVIKAGLGASTIDTDSNGFYDIIQAAQYVCSDDYIDNIAWVGRISGSNKPFVVVLKNVLANSGLTFSPADNAEGIVPVTFVAHYDPSDLDTPPVNIYVPKIQGTVSGYVATGDTAQGTLTVNTLPTVEDTIKVGATTYTFVADADFDSTGKISLGAGLADCQDNIVGAINGTDAYNKANSSVTISEFDTDDAILTAKIPGTDGNTIVTTSDFTEPTNAFDDTTLGATTTGSGGVVAGATVSVAIDGETISVTSKTDGTFAGLKVPIGTYTITATKDVQTGTVTDADVFGGKNTDAGVIIIS
jgi:hypothetical protein